jgi:C-terminal processing protease CtpA/Prc
VLNLPVAIAAYQKDFLDVLVVEKIYRKSQARRLGLQEGDIIFKYHNQRNTDAGNFARIVKAISSKRQIEMIVIREGKTKRFILKGGRIGIKIAESRIPKENLPENLKDLR